MKQSIQDFIDQVAQKNPNEPEFIQAVTEVAETVIPFIEENEKYQGKKLLERMVEPERTLMFRVPWTDDQGEVQVNRGYRIEFNSAIGPYKGGLRFHPSVNLSILKFLGSNLNLALCTILVSNLQLIPKLERKLMDEVNQGDLDLHGDEG